MVMPRVIKLFYLGTVVRQLNNSEEYTREYDLARQLQTQI